MVSLRSLVVLGGAVVALALLLTGHVVGDVLTPQWAVALRVFNVVTATSALVLLAWVTVPSWDRLSVARQDAMLTLMILLFVVAVGAGQAFTAGLPPNELAVAVAFGNVGALRVAWHAATGDYAASGFATRLQRHRGRQDH